MDNETLHQIQRQLGEEAARGFPAGLIRGVTVLQSGDSPAVEPRGLLVRVLLRTDSTQPSDQQLDEFMFRNKTAMTEFRRYLARNVPEAAQLEFTLDEAAGREATRTVLSLRRSTAEENAPGLTPVMARLRPVDLETLDALITAGIVANRAEGLRWALARIRERPAYGQLRERAREIERLKTEF
jgi:hypothetical protein